MRPRKQLNNNIRYVLFEFEKEEKMAEEKIVDNTYATATSRTPRKCPECGHLNPYQRTECRKCKAPLGEKAMSMRCPACGDDVLPTMDKCPTCGMSIDEVKAKSQFSH